MTRILLSVVPERFGLQAIQVSVMATTFHLFPFLPWELRARIWKMTVESRVVEVHTHEYFKRLPDGSERDDLKRIVSNTPVPATLHTCREARFLGLYQKCFSELEIAPEGVEKRYVWLNLDIDMLDLEFRNITDFLPVAERVTRFRYAAFSFDDWQLPGIFQPFCNLKEAHICCMWGAFTLSSWFVSTHLNANLRSREDIRLLDVKTRRWYTAREIDEICDRDIREAQEGAGTGAGSNRTQDDDPGAFHFCPKKLEIIREWSPRYRRGPAHPDLEGHDDGLQS